MKKQTSPVSSAVSSSSPITSSSSSGLTSSESSESEFLLVCLRTTFFLIGFLFRAVKTSPLSSAKHHRSSPLVVECLRSNQDEVFLTAKHILIFLQFKPLISLLRIIPFKVILVCLGVVVQDSAQIPFLSVTVPDTNTSVIPLRCK